MPAHVHVQDVPVPVLAAEDKDLKMQLPSWISGATPKPFEPGLFAFKKVDNGSTAQIHLRVDPDLSGLLLVNASRVMHLNPSAAAIAWCHLNDLSPKAGKKFVSKLFGVSLELVNKDYEELIPTIDALTDPNSAACPVCDLNLEINRPFSAQLSAPYRMDLALTYRCNNDCAHCYNARPRNYPELDTDTWKQVLDKIWSLGIPHVVFTGGEPTLRQDLVQLVSYAQDLGLVTGLNTNGRALKDKDLVNELVTAGLDHVQITLESNLESIHNQMVRNSKAWAETLTGLRNVLKTRLYVMTNTTLLKTNVKDFGDILDFLAAEGVPTVGINALIYSGSGATVNTGIAEKDLPPLLELAHQKTQSNGQRLIWYTPTQYCHFNPVLLGFGVKGCSAAYYNMCIEPDGKVIPCQSYYEAVGDILKDTWQTIWEHPLCLSLRSRSKIDPVCKQCDYLRECGGGCPLAREHQSTPEPIIQSEICILEE